MEIKRKLGFFATAQYRVLDYELRQTNDLYIICCGEEYFDRPKVVGPSTRDGWHHLRPLLLVGKRRHDPSVQGAAFPSSARRGIYLLGR